MTSVTQPEPLEAVVLARISELWKWRSWYRRQPNWANWLDLAIANDAELRALVRLARAARRLAVPDPITEAKAWQDHTADYHRWQARG